MLNAFHLSLHANFGDLLIQPVSKFESTASVGYAVTNTNGTGAQLKLISL